MSSETFTRLFKECDPPAPSIMEGFLLCNGDETLAIVEPTGATIVVSEAHRNGLHKEPWNNGGGQAVNTLYYVNTLKKLLIS